MRGAFNHWNGMRISRVGMDRQRPLVSGSKADSSELQQAHSTFTGNVVWDMRSGTGGRYPIRFNAIEHFAINHLE
jgi:hypothetical protein